MAARLSCKLASFTDSNKCLSRMTEDVALNYKFTLITKNASKSFKMTETFCRDPKLSVLSGELWFVRPFGAI